MGLLKKFTKEYGVTIGGGNVSKERMMKDKKFDKTLLDFLFNLDRIVSTNFDRLD
jgi:hypothetical protein